MTPNKPKFSPLETIVLRDLQINDCGENESLSIDVLSILEEKQMQLLRRQIDYAKNNSRFFAEHLRSVDTSELCRYKDLNKIPLMSADDILQDGMAMACLPFSKIPRFTSIRSSGTQGPVKQLYFSDKDIEKTAVFFSYGVRSMTKDVQRAVIYLPGPTIGSIAQILSTGLNAVGIETMTFGAIKDFEAAKQAYLNFNADCAIGLPSQILQLARTAPQLKPKSAFITADYIPQSLVNAISEAWHCEVLSHYGLSECGLGGGVECPDHSGYHMRHNDLLWEIIDPQTGQTLPYGEYGEVVFSTLNREAMPLIRYRTGDIACLTKEKCACGALLPKLSYIKGRRQNTVFVNNEPITIQSLDEKIFSIAEVLDYQPVVKNDILQFYVKTNSEDLSGIAEKIQSLFPCIKAEIYRGDGFYTRGTIKRKIIIEETKQQ